MLPRLAPSGKLAIAACWASAAAITGASVSVPGVSFWNAAIPALASRTLLTRSAAAARVLA